jgi:ribosomal protein L11 methyltransferase
MPWNEIRIVTSADEANDLSDHLTALGAVAVTFQDAGDEPIFEPKPETPRLWHQTIVIGLFDSETLLESITESLDPLPYQVWHIPDENWERRCLEDFKPIQMGKRLWICPSWHQPPDPQAVNVILDPGLAFGTGSHPTTRLCLEWLDASITPDQSIIDYGCGSGILAIAALKLGAKKALAVDNDPQALIATRDNAERNHIDSKDLITQGPDENITEPADILIANILAQPLKELASHLASLTKPGGKIALSGILKDQAP